MVPTTTADAATGVAATANPIAATATPANSIRENSPSEPPVKELFISRNPALSGPGKASEMRLLRAPSNETHGPNSFGTMTSPRTVESLSRKCQPGARIPLPGSLSKNAPSAETVNVPLWTNLPAS